MNKKKTIVVGAGIIGLCSAYFLNKRGFEVTVIDAGDGMSNCSVGNAGFFCPSHVIPLAAPGIITQGLKWMFNGKSPFYVRPRLNQELISWAWKFKKAATNTRVAKAVPLLHALTTRSQALMEELLQQEPFQDVGYSKTGLLMLSKSRKVLHHEMEAAKIAKSQGQEVEILKPSEVVRFNPELEMDVCGAVYYPNDSMVSPHILLASFRQKLIGQGVNFLLNTAVESLERQNGKIAGVKTADAILRADQFIVTTGSATSAFLKPLGLNLPMQGGKGYSMTIPYPKAKPLTPAILCDGKVSMSPMLDGLRFSGTMEIDGYNPKINQHRIEGIIDTVTSFLPGFQRSAFDQVKPWAGFRPCSPDGLPYIGKPKKVGNLTIATGHAMLGLTLGPITGQLVADIISNQKTFTDISLLDVDRYN
ncbi:MAG: FAD-dependent oxidoreductase [Cyclobacteriaceae bacterium]